MTGNVINAREEPSRTIRRKITLGNPRRGCIYEKAQCQSTVWCGLSLCTINPSMNLIPTDKHSLKTWLVDSSGNIAISRAGVAFLDGQITDLESKCLVGRSRFDDERARRQYAERTWKRRPKRHSKLGRSIRPLLEEQES
jgi:hypothetical protein